MSSVVSIAIIDDDEAVRDSLSMTLINQDFNVTSFASVDASLSGLRADQLPSCVVCDVRMPGLSGLDLQKELSKRYAMVPLVLITGHGDISMAVTAVKAGAHDFIEKPFSPDRLIEGIRSAINQTEYRRTQDEELVRLATRVSELSERQRQVMELAVTGLSNKEIALSLKISPRTVETYRAWVMEKTGARNIADLVRIAMRLEEFRAPS
jgi:two-component system response regulator FixJ